MPELVPDEVPVEGGSSVAPNQGASSSSFAQTAVEDTLPEGVPSFNWVGRPLQQPIETTRYGADYQRVRQRNLESRAGFLESVTPGVRDIPFAGDVVSVADLADLPQIADRIEKNEAVSDEDLVKFNYYMETMERERNRSWLGDFGAAVKGLVTFGAEFGTIAALFGTGIGAAAGSSALGTKLAKEAGVAAAKGAFKRFALQGAMNFRAAGTLLNRSVQDVVTGALGKKLASRVLAKTLGGATEIAATGLLMNTVDRSINKLAGIASGNPDAVTPSQIGTELGQVFSGEGLDREKASWMDWGNMYWEYASEVSGPMMARAAVKTAAKLGLKSQYQRFGEWFKEWAEKTYTPFGEKVLKQKLGAAAAGAFMVNLAKKTKGALDGTGLAMLIEAGGYNGFLEELAEERFGGFMKGLMGLEGDGPGLANAWDQMWPNAHDLSVEMASFALPFLTSSGMHAVANLPAFGGMGVGKKAQLLHMTKAVTRPARKEEDRPEYEPATLEAQKAKIKANDEANVAAGLSKQPMTEDEIGKEAIQQLKRMQGMVTRESKQARSPQAELASEIEPDIDLVAGLISDQDDARRGGDRATSVFRKILDTSLRVFGWDLDDLQYSTVDHAFMANGFYPMARLAGAAHDRWVESHPVGPDYTAEEQEADARTFKVQQVKHWLNQYRGSVKLSSPALVEEAEKTRAVERTFVRLPGGPLVPRLVRRHEALVSDALRKELDAQGITPDVVPFRELVGNLQMSQMDASDVDSWLDDTMAPARQNDLMMLMGLNPGVKADNATFSKVRDSLKALRDGMKGGQFAGETGPSILFSLLPIQASVTKEDFEAHKEGFFAEFTDYAQLQAMTKPKRGSFPHLSKRHALVAAGGMVIPGTNTVIVPLTQAGALLPYHIAEELVHAALPQDLFDPKQDNDINRYLALLERRLDSIQKTRKDQAGQVEGKPVVDETRQFQEIRRLLQTRGGRSELFTKILLHQNMGWLPKDTEPGHGEENLFLGDLTRIIGPLDTEKIEGSKESPGLLAYEFARNRLFQTYKDKAGSPFKAMELLRSPYTMTVGEKEPSRVAEPVEAKAKPAGKEKGGAYAVEKRSPEEMGALESGDTGARGKSESAGVGPGDRKAEAAPPGTKAEEPPVAKSRPQVFAATLRNAGLHTALTDALSLWPSDVMNALMAIHLQIPGKVTQAEADALALDLIKRYRVSANKLNVLRTPEAEAELAKAPEALRPLLLWIRELAARRYEQQLAQALAEAAHVREPDVAPVASKTVTLRLADGSTVPATEEQAKAHDALVAMQKASELDRVAILSGPVNSGKNTVLAAVLKDRLPDTLVVHKANDVAAETAAQFVAEIEDAQGVKGTVLAPVDRATLADLRGDRMDLGEGFREEGSPHKPLDVWDAYYGTKSVVIVPNASQMNYQDMVALRKHIPRKVMIVLVADDAGPGLSGIRSRGESKIQASYRDIKLAKATHELTYAFPAPGTTEQGAVRTTALTARDAFVESTTLPWDAKPRVSEAAGGSSVLYLQGATGAKSFAARVSEAFQKEPEQARLIAMTPTDVSDWNGRIRQFRGQTTLEAQNSEPVVVALNTKARQVTDYKEAQLVVGTEAVVEDVGKEETWTIALDFEALKSGLFDHVLFKNKLTLFPGEKITLVVRPATLRATGTMANVADKRKVYLLVPTVANQRNWERFHRVMREEIRTIDQEWREAEEAAELAKGTHEAPAMSARAATLHRIRGTLWAFYLGEVSHQVMSRVPVFTEAAESLVRNELNDVMNVLEAFEKGAGDRTTQIRQFEKRLDQLAQARRRLADLNAKTSGSQDVLVKVEALAEAGYGFGYATLAKDIYGREYHTVFMDRETFSPDPWLDKDRQKRPGPMAEAHAVYMGLSSARTRAVILREASIGTVDARVLEAADTPIPAPSAKKAAPLAVVKAPQWIERRGGKQIKRQPEFIEPENRVELAEVEAASPAGMSKEEFDEELQLLQDAMADVDTGEARSETRAAAEDAKIFLTETEPEALTPEQQQAIDLANADMDPDENDVRSGPALSALKNLLSQFSEYDLRLLVTPVVKALRGRLKLPDLTPDELAKEVTRVIELYLNVALSPEETAIDPQSLDSGEQGEDEDGTDTKGWATHDDDLVKSELSKVILFRLADYFDPENGRKMVQSFFATAQRQRKALEVDWEEALRPRPGESQTDVDARVNVARVAVANSKFGEDTLSPITYNQAAYEVWLSGNYSLTGADKDAEELVRLLATGMSFDTFRTLYSVLEGVVPAVPMTVSETRPRRIQTPTGEYQPPKQAFWAPGLASSSSSPEMVEAFRRKVEAKRAYATTVAATQAYMRKTVPDATEVQAMVEFRRILQREWLKVRGPTRNQAGEPLAYRGTQYFDPSELANNPRVYEAWAQNPTTRKAIAKFLEVFSGIEAAFFERALYLSRFDANHPVSLWYALRNLEFQSGGKYIPGTDADTKFLAKNLATPQQVRDWYDKLIRDLLTGQKEKVSGEHYRGTLERLPQAASASMAAPYVTLRTVATPEGARTPNYVYLGPHTNAYLLDMERYRRWVADPASNPHLERTRWLRNSSLVKLLGVAREGRIQNASQFATGDRLLQALRDRFDMDDGRMFVDFWAGDRRWVLGLEIDRPDAKDAQNNYLNPAHADRFKQLKLQPDFINHPEKRQRMLFELNLTIARQNLDRMVMGDAFTEWGPAQETDDTAKQLAEYEGNRILTYNKRSATFTTQGRPMAMVQGGLPPFIRVAVVADKAKELDGFNGVFPDDAKAIMRSIGLLTDELVSIAAEWDSLPATEEGDKEKMRLSLTLRTRYDAATPAQAFRNLSALGSSFKLGLAGKAGGTPLLIKGNTFVLTPEFLAAQGPGSAVATVSKWIADYNAAVSNPSMRVTMIVGSETLKSPAQGRQVTTGAGNVVSFWVPVYSTFFDQAALTEVPRVRPIPIAFQLTSDTQSLPSNLLLNTMRRDIVQAGVEAVVGDPTFTTPDLGRADPWVRSLSDANLSRFYPTLLPWWSLSAEVALRQAGRGSLFGFRALNAPSARSPNVSDMKKVGPNQYRAGIAIAHMDGPGVAYAAWFDTVDEAINFLVGEIKNGHRLDMVNWDPGNPSTGTPEALVAQIRTMAQEALRTPSRQDSITEAIRALVVGRLRLWELNTEIPDPKTGKPRVMVPGSLIQASRTPGTSLASHIFVRLGFDPGIAFGNNLMMHQDIITRAGVDYDGDTMHVYTFSPGARGHYFTMPPALDEKTDPPESVVEARVAGNVYLWALYNAYNEMPEGALKVTTDPRYFQNNASFRNLLAKVTDGLPAQIIQDVNQAMAAADRELTPRAKYILNSMMWAGKSALGAAVNNLGMIYYTLFNNGVTLKPFPGGELSGFNSIEMEGARYRYAPESMEWDATTSPEARMLMARRGVQYLRVFNNLVNMLVDDPKWLQVWAAGITRENVALLELLFMGSAVEDLLAPPVKPGEDQFAADQKVADALFTRLLNFLNTPIVKKFSEINAQVRFDTAEKRYPSPDEVFSILTGRPRRSRGKNPQPLPPTTFMRDWARTHPNEKPVDPNGGISSLLRHMQETNNILRRVGGLLKIGFNKAAGFYGMRSMSNLVKQLERPITDRDPRTMVRVLDYSGLLSSPLYEAAKTVLSYMETDVFPTNQHPFHLFGLVGAVDALGNLQVDTAAMRRARSLQTKLNILRGSQEALAAEIATLEAEQADSGRSGPVFLAREDWVPGSEKNKRLYKALDVVGIDAVRRLPSLSPRVALLPLKELSLELLDVLKVLRAKGHAWGDLLNGFTWADEEADAMAPLPGGFSYADDYAALMSEVDPLHSGVNVHIGMENHRVTTFWTPDKIAEYQKAFAAIPDVAVGTKLWTSRDIQVALLLTALRQYGFSGRGIERGNFLHLIPASLHKEVEASIQTMAAAGNYTLSDPALLYVGGWADNYVALPPMRPTAVAQPVVAQKPMLEAIDPTTLFGGKAAEILAPLPFAGGTAKIGDRIPQSGLKYLCDFTSSKIGERLAKAGFEAFVASSSGVTSIPGVTISHRFAVVKIGERYFAVDQPQSELYEYDESTVGNDPNEHMVIRRATEYIPRIFPVTQEGLLPITGHKKDKLNLTEMREQPGWWEPWTGDQAHKHERTITVPVTQPAVAQPAVAPTAVAPTAVAPTAVAQPAVAQPAVAQPAVAQSTVVSTAAAPAPAPAEPTAPATESVFSPAEQARFRAAAQESAYFEAISKATAALRKSRPKRAKNAKLTRAARFNYETEVLLTPTEQEYELLPNVPSKMIPPVGRGGEKDPIRTMLQTMPKHHVEQLFDAEKGVEVDVAAKEAGYDGRIEEFAQRLHEESDRRVERWNQQDDLASRGIFIADRESLEQYLEDERRAPPPEPQLSALQLANTTSYRLAKGMFFRQPHLRRLLQGHSPDDEANWPVEARNVWAAHTAGKAISELMAQYPRIARLMTLLRNTTTPFERLEREATVALAHFPRELGVLMNRVRNMAPQYPGNPGLRPDPRRLDPDVQGEIHPEVRQRLVNAAAAALEDSQMEFPGLFTPHVNQGADEPQLSAINILVPQNVMNPGGTEVMHRVFRKAMANLTAMTQGEQEDQQFKRAYYGLTSQDYLEHATIVTDANGRRLRFDPKRRTPWTEENRSQVRYLSMVASVLAQDPTVRGAIRAKKNVKAAVLAAMSTNTMPYGHDFTDQSGNSVKDNELAAAAWARFRASEAARKLEAAGREVSVDALVELLTSYSNLYDASYEMFKEQLGFVPNYLPLIFGAGYADDPATKAAVANVRREVIKAGNSINPAETLMPSGNEYEFPDPAAKQIPGMTAVQKALLLQYDPALRMAATSGIPGQVAAMTEGWTMADANAALHRALMDHEVTTARVKGAAYKPDPQVIKTIRKLGDMLNHYVNRAWSARAESRRLPGASTYEAAYQRYGLKPMTLDIFDLRDLYVRDLYSAMTRRALLHQMLVSTDLDGRPLVLVVPSEDQQAKKTFNPQVLMEHARQVARYYGLTLPPLNTTNVYGVLRSMVFNQMIPRDRYEIIPSAYPDVDEFRATKGDAASVMKSLILEPSKLMMGHVDVFEQIHRTVQWTKMLSVGFSVFFPISLMESVVAGTGLAKNVLYEALPHPKKWMDGLLKIAEELKDPTSYYSKLVRELTQHEVELGHINLTDTATGVVDTDIANLVDRITLQHGEKAGKWAKQILSYVSGRKWSNLFFNSWFPVMKVWAAERLMKTMANKLGANLADPAERDRVLSLIADPINDAYGGQFWAKYLWANPKVMQRLNWTLFAPNWTLSAANIGGMGLLTGRFLGNAMSQENADFVFKQNWPAMLLLVMTAVPAALQAAIWAMTRVGGDPDDQPLPWMNEEGRKWRIDITPLIRLSPGYSGDPTGKRRVYMQFGKQAWEVLDGWLTEPVNQFLRKLSQPARLVLEELTGRSPGSDWNLEFQGQGMIGWLKSEKEGLEGFLTSRVGYALQKFLPMSLVQTLRNPELGLWTTLAPLSKGMSMGKAVAEFTKILEVYADDQAYNALVKSPVATERLAALAPGLLDAAAANGYDVKKIVNSAKGAVLAPIYKKVWEAVNDNDPKRVEKLARQALRVGGSISGAYRSMKNRAQDYGRPFSAEMQAAIDDAFGRKQEP